MQNQKFVKFLVGLKNEYWLNLLKHLFVYAYYRMACRSMSTILTQHTILYHLDRNPISPNEDTILHILSPLGILTGTIIIPMNISIQSRTLKLEMILVSCQPYYPDWDILLS